MLPTAPLPSTRLTAEDILTLQPVKATTGVIDVLSEFVPGQKLVAQIQAQLANGAFRATIAQRDVTLALPFSAKTGDTLELEVVETNGRIAFAVSRPAPLPSAPQSSATTTLSSTGQLIAQLLDETQQAPLRPTTLNGNQPVLAQPAASSAETAPRLQKSLSQSGLFYESHQAEWLQGRRPELALRAEPQASVAIPARYNFQNSAPGAALAQVIAQAMPDALPGSPAAARVPPGIAGNNPLPVGDGDGAPAEARANGIATGSPLRTAGQPEAVSNPAGMRLPMGEAVAASQTESARAALPRTGMASEVAPIVQQQLASLATNNYSFQGMIWANQPFLWEVVDEDGERRPDGEDDPPRPWKTRLKLLLPSLGDIDATIELQGSEVNVAMRSSTGHTRQTLQSRVAQLRDRMELAGLRLMALDIRPVENLGTGRQTDEPGPT